MFFLALALFTLFTQSSCEDRLWSWTGDDFPPPRTSTGPFTPSACSNGQQAGPPFAFACPHMSLLSDDMIGAALSDGFEQHRLVYAVAGGASDDECGVCYQVQFLDAERVWRDDFPIFVVQIINSGGDVMHGQLDIMVGAGGFGWFTACNSDCQVNHCNGGPCQESLYDGDFRAWTDAEYDDPHRCYEGSVKWLNDTSTTMLLGKCRRLCGPDGPKTFKDRVLVSTCMRGNLGLFHQNMVSAKRLRVACPHGLYRLTGLRRADDNQFPQVSLSNTLTEYIQGSREQGHYSGTTMFDGCVPSCAWAGKVEVDPHYQRVDRCDHMGIPIHE